jgi:hypothetical protein
MPCSTSHASMVSSCLSAKNSKIVDHKKLWINSKWRRELST